MFPQHSNHTPAWKHRSIPWSQRGGGATWKAPGALQGPVPGSGLASHLTLIYTESAKAKESCEFTQEKKFFLILLTDNTKRGSWYLGKLYGYLELATNVGWTYIFFSGLIKNKTLKYTLSSLNIYFNSSVLLRRLIKN